MLCRRCGLESSTTDVCEWCNRPMLPAGATVSGKAAKELKKSGQPVVVPVKAAGEPQVGLPLDQQQEEEPEIGVEADSDTQQPADDVLLRPLGHASAGDRSAVAPSPPIQTSARPGAPSHGLSADATATSVDISQYVGKDQSIFRPLRKEASYSSAASLERVTQKKSAQAEAGPDWSENQRLMRCAIAGLIIGTVFAVAGYFLSGSVPDKLIVLPLGRGGGIFAAIKFGILSGGVLFGFMLGALLVRFQKGPFIGMIAGLLLGFSVQNGVWGYLAGAITGIVVGRLAILGVRRVVNV